MWYNTHTHTDTHTLTMSASSVSVIMRVNTSTSPATNPDNKTACIEMCVCACDTQRQYNTQTHTHTLAFHVVVMYPPQHWALSTLFPHSSAQHVPRAHVLQVAIDPMAPYLPPPAAHLMCCCQRANQGCHVWWWSNVEVGDGWCHGETLAVKCLVCSSSYNGTVFSRV